MLPASSKGGGQALAFPDVCKTPTPGGPVPIPYPNMGMLVQVKKESKKVKIVGKGAVTKKSQVPRSQGDEPGTLGGLVSNMNMGKITFKKGSSKVKVEGQPLQHLSAPTAHNGVNANAMAGMVVVPSQLKVLVTPGPSGPFPQGLRLDGIAPYEYLLAASTLTTLSACRARRKITKAFLRQKGQEWNRETNAYHRPTEGQIRDQARCHNPRKPLIVGPEPPCPPVQGQWQKPGGNQGSYYADPGTPPGRIGIAGEASNDAGQIVPKISKNYRIAKEAPYLQSTASPAKDKWSIKGQVVDTPGGGIQRLIPDRSLAII